jgi:hypothetical protein
MITIAEAVGILHGEIRDRSVEVTLVKNPYDETPIKRFTVETPQTQAELRCEYTDTVEDPTCEEHTCQTDNM